MTEIIAEQDMPELGKAVRKDLFRMLYFEYISALNLRQCIRKLNELNIHYVDNGYEIAHYQIIKNFADYDIIIMVKSIREEYYARDTQTHSFI